MKYKYLRFLNKYATISFLTGFCLMAFELAAARILAPTIGSSTYVWTSVIGTIIAALSLGYWAGGIIADKRKQPLDVAWLLLAASSTVTACLLVYGEFLPTLAESEMDVRFQAVLAALVLFAPASFVLGMISPYLVKLNVRSLTSSGRSVASLSALNSIGGIVGTFLTGFVLFGYIGSRQTIIIVAVLLLVASWMILWRSRFMPRVGLSLLVLLFLAIANIPLSSSRIQIDTASAHYGIQDFYYNNQPVRGLTTGPSGIQSAVALSGSKEPVFWYTNELARLTLDKKPQSVLVLGGGTFTLPEYLAQKLPDARIDVVEIDPKLESIATQYFGYDSPQNVNLIFADARTYINQTDVTYDVIIADVYGDSSIPFSLITKEYGHAVAARLNAEGIVLANIIGGETGPCRDVFDAANAAYLQKLRYGSYRMNPTSDARRGNIIALYSSQSSESSGFRSITNRTTAYDDNFVPDERLYFACESQRSLP